MHVALRPLTRDDFGLLGGWLHEPHVHEWWHDDPDPAALERQYAAAQQTYEKLKTLKFNR